MIMFGRVKRTFLYMKRISKTLLLNRLRLNIAKKVKDGYVISTAPSI